jgi:phosphate transport system permease protein
MTDISITGTRTVQSRIVRSRILHVVVCVLAGLTAVPLLAIIGKVVVEGWRQLSWNFFTQSTPSSVEAMMATATHSAIPGGIANGIVGTLLMLLMAAAIAIPVGVCCGVFLSEKRGTWYANIVSYMTDLLQGTPSIIIGIIIYVWVVIPTNGYSALAGSVALFIMMLPLIVRSTEETLSMLPTTLKEAGMALGGNYPRVIFKVLLPSAFGGIFTGILLAVSRVIGETAPLMFTALGCYTMQWNVSQPMSAVPLLIWQFFNDPNLQPLIWSASLFLLLFVLVLNVGSKWVARKWKV